MEPCPNCGQPVRSTARFCTSCGYRIPERPAGSTDDSSSGFASTWIEESTGAAPTAEVAANPDATWPVAAASEPPAPAAVEWVAPAPVAQAAVVDDSVYAPPAVAADPLDEIVAATAGFNAEDDTISTISQNKVNIALYHIETLRQLLPDLSNWTEDRAEAVNDAIAAMEAAIKGREADDDTYANLRHTIATAKREPRDIDVMIALSDRAAEIEDLLAAHDKYSIGIRTALIDLKPLAVEYVRVPKKRTSAVPRTSSSRSTASKTTTTSKSTTPSKSTTASKSAASTKTTASKSTSTATKNGAAAKPSGSTTARKTTSRSTAASS